MKKKEKKNLKASLTKNFNVIIRMSVGHELPETRQISIGTDVKQHITINKEGCEYCISIICNSISTNA